MIKTIIKETAIVLLLVIAIGLLLAIVFYDYMPTSKVIPAKVVAHELPNEVEEELKNTVVSTTENIVKTYVITSKDLGAYESNDKYDKGKENPFAITSDSTLKYNNTINSIDEEKETYKGK